MGQRIRPSRSGLVAIELVIAVGVFALCAAIAIGLLVRAELSSGESADLTRAVSEARTAAECYKAAGGDLLETADLLGTALADEDSLTVAYAKDWTRMGDEAEHPAVTLVMHKVSGTKAHVQEAELRVIDEAGAELVFWTVAAMEGVP